MFLLFCVNRYCWTLQCKCIFGQVSDANVTSPIIMLRNKNCTLFGTQFWREIIHSASDRNTSALWGCQWVSLIRLIFKGSSFELIMMCINRCLKVISVRLSHLEFWLQFITYGLWVTSVISVYNFNIHSYIHILLFSLAYSFRLKLCMHSNSKHRELK